MSKKLLLVVASLIFLFPMLSGVAVSALEDDLELANRLFAEHSYKPALEAYRRVYADESRSTDVRGHTAVRIGECLRRLKKWDEALAFLRAEESRFASSRLWRARIVALRGSIALTMPHWYYQKGDEISRVRWIQGATYHYTYYDDLIAAMKDLEEAAHLYEPFVKEAPDGPKERERRAAEFAGICFEQATALEAHRTQKGGFVGFEPAPDVKADYAKHGIGRHHGTDPQAWYRLAEKAAKKLGRTETAALAR